MSGLQPPVLACIAACWLMTAWAAAGPVPAKSDLLPTLQRQPMASKSAAYYLAAGEDWRPGGVPQISVLMAEEPLVFHIESAGSQAGLQSVRLLFKCSSGDSEFEEALLETGVQSSTHCRPLRPFKLERLSASLYRLTLLRENQVPFEQALRHSLELRLRLSFYQGVLESASLFIFNFDALSKIPDNPRLLDRRGQKWCTYCPEPSAKYTEFVHLAAYPFVVGHGEQPLFYRQSDDGNSHWYIQILRDEFVNAIKLAKPMVRNLLSLTLFYSLNCSDSSQQFLVLATAGVGRTADRNSFKAMKEVFLDLDNGMFYVTIDGYDQFKKQLYMREAIQSVCLNISVKGGLWPYSLTFLIAPALNFSSRGVHRFSRSADLALETELTPKTIRTPPVRELNTSESLIKDPVPSEISIWKTATTVPSLNKPTTPVPTLIRKSARVKSVIDPEERITAKPDTSVPSLNKPTTTVPTLIRKSARVKSVIDPEEPFTGRAMKPKFEANSEHTRCYLPDNRTSSTIQLPANLYNLSLECPVFCDDDFTILVGFESIHCSRHSSRDIDSRPLCSRFIYFSPHSCEIRLLGPTSQMHSGNYTVLVGEIRYTYHVSVVSLPVFTMDSLSAGTHYLNSESTPATLGCAVTYFGVQPVDIVPQFKLLERFRPGLHWTLVSPRIFGDKIFNGDPRGVEVITNRTDMGSELSVRIKSRKREAWWVSWKAAFECSASVTQSEAGLFGLPEYRVRATWNLAYIKDLSQIERSGVSELQSVLRLCFVLSFLSASCTLCGDFFC